MARRVVITGMGIWSCLGKNKEEVSVALREGKSGIGIDPQRIEYGYRSPLTGIVERPQLKGKLDRKLRMYLAEEGEYAYMATAEALRNAGIDMDYLARVHGSVPAIKAADDAAEALWIPIAQVNPAEFGLTSIRNAVIRFLKEYK